MSEALVWALLGAGFVALVLLFLVLIVRERRAAGERFAAATQELSARMDGLVEELRAARGRSGEDDQRARILGELAATIDLDEVLARVLEAAGAMTGVDAALVSVESSAREKPSMATVGLSPEEAESQALAVPPMVGRDAPSVTISYEYPPSAARDAIRHGIAVPIPGEVGAIGSLAVFSRADERSFTDADRRSLEDLAARAGPAVENARRFREARQLADLDALTELHNRRYFHETLEREVARAQRYGRKLALIIFDLDDFKAINDRIGHLAGDGVLAEVAHRVRSVVRSADVACRVGGDEFGIILPESTLTDAELLSHRIQAAVASRSSREAGTLGLSAGAAELRSEDDATKLFERADDALYRAKKKGKAEFVAAGLTEAPRSEASGGRALGPRG